MKKLIFLFAFSIAVTNIFAQTDPTIVRIFEYFCHALKDS